jgi:hypothetical protein
MKKFIDYLIEQERVMQYQSTVEKDTPLSLYGKLDIANRQFISNKMVEIFTNMLKNTNKFEAAINFILKNYDSATDEESVKSIGEKVKEFFANPIEKGLPYISGENQIVNGHNANPNINGMPNASPINVSNYQ